MSVEYMNRGIAAIIENIQSIAQRMDCRSHGLANLSGSITPGSDKLGPAEILGKIMHFAAR